ncbi:MAG: M23 family metallopeptidase, partial [Pedobacter sp.]
TKAFLDGLKQQAGQLKTMAFQKKAGSVYSTYVSQFDKALLAVDFALDNDNRVAGFSVHNYNPSTAAKPARNRSKLSFPLKGSWTITWGGDTKEQNYHVESEAQKNAFDILITDQAGKTYRNSGKSNEDFYAFGKEISAPCDGEIVLAVNGVKDNIPGELNSFDVGGNTVILKTANNEYLVFCHLKHASMLVKEGQKITKGQLLGLVGNSGHSSEAHLHFHIQNQEQMNNATGIKCYFDKIVVDGKVKQDYSPVQNEKVSL